MGNKKRKSVYRKLLSSIAMLAVLAGCGKGVGEEAGNTNPTPSEGGLPTQQASPPFEETEPSGQAGTSQTGDPSTGTSPEGTSSTDASQAEDPSTTTSPERTTSTDPSGTPSGSNDFTHTPKDLAQIQPVPAKEVLFENDFLLYFVNCTSIASTTSDGFGLFQSVPDQAFGEDAGSGRSWGYLPQDYMVAEGDTRSENRKDSKWMIAEDVSYDEDTGYRYFFELPEGEYEVTCGFYNPFSPKTIDIRAEGEEVVTGQKILKFKDTQHRFTVAVTDGELELFVYNTKRGVSALQNPELSYIIIKAVPDYDAELLAMLLDKTALSQEEAQAYRAVTLQGYREARERAQALANELATAPEGIPAADGVSAERIREVYEDLKYAFGRLEKKMVYNSFRPGKIWQDQDGNKIQAHGGQVQKLTVADKETGKMVEKWWWVGEDKTAGYRGGICAYSSDDLYNWKFEGVVMRNITSREQLDTEDYFKELYAGYTEKQLDNVYRCINDSTSVIERPKMIYNEKSGQYLLWFHADGPTETSNANYAAASAGLAVSDSPYGPFRFVDRYRLNTCPKDQEDMHPQSKGMARDMNLFIDDDGTAYIIYSSEENLTIYISKLNDTYDYLCTEPENAVYGRDFIRLYPGAQREAPAIIKRDGRYYLMTSGATGWAPNQARYWVADEIFGTWEDMGDPCIGDEKRTTFDSQSTCLFQAEDGTIVYMGDRWNADDLSDSRYIWLPVRFDGEGKMSMEWQDEWTLTPSGEGG